MTKKIFWNRLHSALIFEVKYSTMIVLNIIFCGMFRCHTDRNYPWKKVAFHDGTFCIEKKFLLTLLSGFFVGFLLIPTCRGVANLRLADLYKGIRIQPLIVTLRNRERTWKPDFLRTGFGSCLFSLNISPFCLYRSVTWAQFILHVQEVVTHFI